MFVHAEKIVYSLFQQKWRGSIEVEASSHSCLKLERQESKGWLLTQYLGVFLWWDYKSFDGTHNRLASNVIEPAFFLTSSSWIKWQTIEKHYIFILFIVALYEQLMFVYAEKIVYIFLAKMERLNWSWGKISFLFEVWLAVE